MKVGIINYIRHNNINHSSSLVLCAFHTGVRISLGFKYALVKVENILT